VHVHGFDQGSGFREPYVQAARRRKFLGMRVLVSGLFNSMIADVTCAQNR
jgi:hypothetical protein